MPPATVTAGELVDALLKRVRDVEGLATTRDQARLLLSHAERAVNAATGLIVETATVTLDARRTVYQLSRFRNRAVRLTTVRVNGEDLRQTTFASLGQANRRWVRQIGTPRIWAMLGRELLAIVPAPPTAAACELNYVLSIPPMATDGSLLTLPVDRVPLVLNIAEAWCSLRHRLAAVSAPPTNRAVAALGLEGGA